MSYKEWIFCSIVESISWYVATSAPGGK